MKALALLLLSSLGCLGQADITLEAFSTVSTNAGVTSWQLQEQSGAAWTNRGRVSITSTNGAERLGQLTLSNVTAGIHTFRVYAFNGSSTGLPSGSVSTNIPASIWVVDVQTAKAIGGPWTNYSTMTLPPVPGRSLGEAYIRAVIRRGP